MGTDDRVNAGQAVYTPLTLKVYDHAVHGFSNRFLWRCPTSLLEEMYDRNVSDDHLDIGVGTGYFLDKATWPSDRPTITLFDLNPNSLKAASDRIARHAPTSIRADILKPLRLDRTFRSVGLCYLLHCLPGALSDKAATVFDNVLGVTAPGATIFGATILQGDAPRSLFAQGLMNVYNRRGIFSNADDTRQALDRVLSERFDSYRVTQHGVVAIFEAAKK